LRASLNPHLDHGLANASSLVAEIDKYHFYH
jgi:hypothetical protein